MKLFLCVVVGVMLAASAAFAVDKGTIETGGSLDLHLKPSPYVFNADMYLLYYMNNMLGVGPFWSLEKMGKPEGASETPPTLYSLGAMGKLYLPMAYMNGKLTPFVEAGFGIISVQTTLTDTEHKGEFMMKVGFDYWLTDKWTVWCAYQGEKVFVTGSEFQSDIRVGIATFIMK
ncbi:MAG TPA: hypothetical protein VMU02_03650 [bacterium]|nr:hypothetical protein [bacterium]